MNLRVVLPALLTAAALFFCVRSEAVAAPALWMVQSPVGKVYLFGTVHLLREGVQWRSPQLEAAMRESQDLYLEIADPANKTAALSFIKIGLDRDHPLSSKISKADVALLDEAAKRDGFGGEATFEPMQPWLVYAVLAVVPVTHSGYSAANGVDVQVRQEFVSAGKPVYGFETFAQQAHIFADMSQAEQVALLETELKQKDTTTAASLLDRIVDAWLSGNEDGLSSLLQMDTTTETPFEQRMLSDRNQAWAKTLADRLKQPGTSFVSVGAAHLVGPDGVPALLQRMGFTVTRVQIPETVATPSPAASARPAPQAGVMASPGASPLPSAAPGASASPSAPPSPAASASPIPQTLTPPPDWIARPVSFASGPFKSDKMWVDPHHSGVIVTGHVDLPGISAGDLDQLNSGFREGMVAGAGTNGKVGPSKRVKICNGTQDGIYTEITLKNITEDIVIGVSDRGYLAQYVRRTGAAANPAASKSLLSLCAP